MLSKCTRVWNNITNMKAEQRGSGEGINLIWAQYESIVPHMKMALVIMPTLLISLCKYFVKEPMVKPTVS